MESLLTSLLPSREIWETLLSMWQLFPIITAMQWIVEWYPAGKTSVNSNLNLPGKWGWLTMELPGPIIVLWLVKVLPGELHMSSLPWQNLTMAGMYTLHYIYRAILFPILNPSMSPMHIVVWLMGVAFNIINGLVIGGWLAGYGPTSQVYWNDRLGYVYFGMLLWAYGLLGNMFHDDDLREIRRSAKKEEEKQNEIRDKKERGKNGRSASLKSDIRVYKVPKNGLFQLVLHAHYLCEWIEWTGFWIFGGWAFVPGRAFLLNEISTMLPRALQGKRWYIEHFGEEAIQGRKAVIPGLL